MNTTNGMHWSGSTRPTPTKLKLTGAALRSMEAADTIANAAWDRLIAIEESIAAHWSAAFDGSSRKPVDAVWLANAYRLSSERAEAIEGVRRLAVRWQPGIQAVYLKEPHVWANTDTIRVKADDYISTLRAAGVAMGDEGCYLAEYWDDAAARGC